MKPLPYTDEALVLRTAFGDQDGWISLCGEITAPVDGFTAYVTPVDDPAYAGVSVDQLLTASRGRADRSFLIVADDVTFAHPEHVLLVIDLWDQPGRTFRVVPGALQSVENNLSIANMDFADFAESVDDNGVFRGF